MSTEPRKVESRRIRLRRSNIEGTIEAVVYAF